MLRTFINIIKKLHLYKSINIFAFKYNKICICTKKSVLDIYIYTQRIHNVITHSILTGLGKGKIIAVKVIVHTSTLSHQLQIIQHMMCEGHAWCVISILFKIKQFLFTNFHFYFYFSMDLQSLEIM